MTGFLSQEQISSFHEKGYVIADFGFDEKTIDALVNKLHPIYNRERLKAPAFGARIQDAWKMVEESHSIAIQPNVLSALEQLYGKKPLPFQTLNFPIGTQQAIHSDTIHFNSQPSGYMAGVWLALEDIDLNNGPLIYYPGSHKLPELTMQDIGLDPGYHNYRHYEEHLAGYVATLGIEPELGSMRKGQALIWHANLLHGGSAQKDLSRSRHSQVTHYFFEGCRYYTPMFSTSEKPAWRDPEWIPRGDWKPVPKLEDRPLLARQGLRLKSWLKRKLRGY